MAKYRKKPVVIEAFQYDGDLKDRDGSWYVPAWAVEAYERQPVPSPDLHTGKTVPGKKRPEAYR